ncbi:unnamed protein product, partial [Linum tenue]
SFHQWPAKSPIDTTARTGGGNTSEIEGPRETMMINRCRWKQGLDDDELTMREPSIELARSVAWKLSKR